MSQLPGGSIRIKNQLKECPVVGDMEMQLYLLATLLPPAVGDRPHIMAPAVELKPDRTNPAGRAEDDGNPDI